MSDKKSAFDYFVEIIGWLRIVSSPLAIALVIAGFVYFPNPGNMRLIIAIVIVIVGLVIGIIVSTILVIAFIFIMIRETNQK